MPIEMAKQLQNNVSNNNKSKTVLLKNLFFIILQKTNLKHKLL